MAELLPLSGVFVVEVSVVEVGVVAVDTPWGLMHVVATDSAVVRVCLPGEAPPVGGGVNPVAYQAAEALAAACVGGPARWPAWSIEGVPPFYGAVLRALAEVPAGQVVTYGQLARAAGRPAAVRAAASACAQNPLPIVVPCHRVVPARGGVGSYRAGQEMKRELLRLEGVVFPS